MCGTGLWRTATSLPDVLEPFADAQPEDRSWPAPVYDESGALPTNPRKVVKLAPGSSLVDDHPQFGSVLPDISGVISTRPCFPYCGNSKG